MSEWVAMILDVNVTSSDKDVIPGTFVIFTTDQTINICCIYYAIEDG
jgi:hypothetical protein